MDIYNSPKPKANKSGVIFLLSWIASLVALIIFLTANPESNFITKTLITILCAGVLLLLPAWGLTLKNRFVKVLTLIPVLFVVLGFIIYTFIARVHKSSGNSMLPSFPPGEYMVSEKVSYYFRQPKRGEIVIFSFPNMPSEQYFARIIGLPEEYIAIRSGHIYINNKILNEPYLSTGAITEASDFIGTSNILIPDGEYAILGDNRSHSYDSRAYGFVKKSFIIGRLYYIYWPEDMKGLVTYPQEAF